MQEAGIIEPNFGRCNESVLAWRRVLAAAAVDVISGTCNDPGLPTVPQGEKWVFLTRSRGPLNGCQAVCVVHRALLEHGARNPEQTVAQGAKRATVRVASSPERGVASVPLRVVGHRSTRPLKDRPGQALVARMAPQHDELASAATGHRRDP